MTALFETCVAYHYGDGMNFKIEKKMEGVDYSGKYGNGCSLIAVADTPAEIAEKIVAYFRKWDKEKSKFDHSDYEFWAKQQLSEML